jgi:hypothetical protein
MLDHNFLVMLARILSFGLKGQHMENGRRIVGCYCLEAGVEQRDTELTERAPNAGSQFSCDAS